jgi:hypothetical protein
MSKIGNFTPNYQIIFGGYIVPKNNPIVNQSIRISRIIPDEVHKTKFHMTTTFFDAEFGIFVTPSEFYTNFEKLLLPFDTTTWILLLVTFLVISGVIFLMKFIPKKIKKIFIGSGNKTPGFNVVRIFFGIGQTRLPDESILRFILIFFVFFWLILRTCYQSKLFEFITADMRKPAPRTLDELIERDFTINLVNDTAVYEVLYDAVIKRNKKCVLNDYF